MKFCVIRHPDLDGLGTSPETALEHHRAQGWFRVSEWRNEATDFHLADFTDAVDDLDPPPPAAEPEPEQPPIEDQPEPATAARKKENKA